MDDDWRVAVYADDAERRRELIATDRRISIPVGVEVIDGGVISPLLDSTDGFHYWEGGVSDRDGTFVAGHRYHPTLRHNRNVVASYAPPSDVPYVPEAVVYAGGSGSTHFGHFLAETLSRLWWVVQNPASPVRVVFNTRGLTADHHLVQLITHVGLDREQILILDKPTRFDKVIVPDQAFFLGSGEHHTSATKMIYDKIRDSVTPGGLQKVYLTRTGFHGRNANLRELNEAMIEDFYRSQGYEIVAPESMRLDEQISVVAGAGCLASTAGTLSHLVLFSPDQVRQDIVLRSPRSFRLFGQWGMNQLRGSTLRVVDATLQMLPGFHWSGVVLYSETPHWLDYTKSEFGVVIDREGSHERVADLLRNWAEVLAGASARELESYPAWTVADFVASFHRALTGAPLDRAATARLTRRFGSHTLPTIEEMVTVMFEVNGGSPVEARVVRNGELVAEPAAPERAGFGFVGWFTSPRLKTPVDFSSPVSNSKTLHAKWTAVGAQQDGRHQSN